MDSYVQRQISQSNCEISSNGDEIKFLAHARVAVVSGRILGTFRSEDEDDYEYEFSVLSMRTRFGGRHFSKCARSEQKTRTRSRPRPPI